MDIVLKLKHPVQTAPWIVTCGKPDSWPVAFVFAIVILPSL